jgi:hypothetical protein
VKYELGFYIPEDGILHSHHRETLKSDIVTAVIFPSVQNMTDETRWEETDAT